MKKTIALLSIFVLSNTIGQTNIALQLNSTTQALGSLTFQLNKTQ